VEGRREQNVLTCVRVLLVRGERMDTGFGVGCGFGVGWGFGGAPIGMAGLGAGGGCGIGFGIGWGFGAGFGAKYLDAEVKFTKEENHPPVNRWAKAMQETMEKVKHIRGPSKQEG